MRSLVGRFPSSPEVIADEEAIETPGTQPGHGGEMRPEVIADEEAIET